MATLQTTFEPIFAKHATAKAIPPAYMRALAYRESAFRPAIVHPQSHATGLFQITSTALNDFNHRTGSALRLAELVDPDANTRVAADHIASVVKQYSRYRSLTPDWSSPRWVALLTFGWNAGHGALMNIVGALEGQQIPPERITVDTVNQVAAVRGGAARFLADPARARWSKSVAALFLGAGPPEMVYASALPVPSSGKGLLVLVGLGVAGAIAAAVLRTKEEER